MNLVNLISYSSLKINNKKIKIKLDKLEIKARHVVVSIYPKTL